VNQVISELELEQLRRDKYQGRRPTRNRLLPGGERTSAGSSFSQRTKPQLWNHSPTAPQWHSHPGGRYILKDYLAKTLARTI
jgi:hypothetical protein